MLFAARRAPACGIERGQRVTDTEATDPAAPPQPGDLPWQPLPDAARLVYRLTGALTALALGVGLALLPFLVYLKRLDPLVMAAVVGAILLAAGLVGGWLGGLRHGRVFMRLDADGLQVRRGLCWRSETRVPRSRVQHIDIERGPLLRRRGLATLVVHTAGTRLNAVRVVGLGDHDARRLRDALVDREGADDDAV
jgi:membrane protein YdbS with pleckstrin-like domain